MPPHHDEGRLLLSRLRTELGDDAVTDCASADRDERTADHVSGLAVGRPLAWVRPTTSEQVARVVRAAAEAGRRVVAVGKATTFWGGLDVQDAVALDVLALRDPFHIDVDARFAHVGAGWNLRAIDAAARGHGLCVASRPDAAGDTPVASLVAVGATSGLGMGHGLAIDQISGATVVTGRGEIARIGASHLLHGRPHGEHGMPNALSLLAAAEGRGAILTEVGLRLRRTPHVATLRMARPEGPAPSVEALGALLGVAREALDRGSLDTFRIELGAQLGAPVGRLELMLRSHSDRSIEQAVDDAERARRAFASLGFALEALDPETAAAHAGHDPDYAAHWSFGPEEHRRRLLGAAFWGAEITATWGPELTRALARATALYDALAQIAPVHRRFAVYPGHHLVSVGVHLLAGRDVASRERAIAALAEATPDLTACGVPYRRGALFRGAIDARLARADAVASRELVDALFGVLDPGGIIGSAGRPGPGPR